MRRKSGCTLFVRLDMAHLATIRTFPLRSLLLLAWRGGGSSGRRARGTGSSGVGGRCGGHTLGFFAGKTSFSIAFEASEFCGDSEGEEGSAGQLRDRAFRVA